MSYQGHIYLELYGDDPELVMEKLYWEVVDKIEFTTNIYDRVTKAQIRQKGKVLFEYTPDKRIVKRTDWKIGEREQLAAELLQAGMPLEEILEAVK